MALKGTLADLGVVDLIQFPHKGRRTGELVIVGSDDEARLYYVDGNLVHVKTGELMGMEALAEVVSQAEGEFEFRMGATQDERTVNMDLHRALMFALKTRDERAEDERKRREEAEQSDEPEVQKLLTQVVHSDTNIQGACIFSDEGAILAEAVSDDEDPKQLAALRESMISLYKDYGPGLTRTFLEDQQSIIHGSRLARGSVAILTATRETSMGALSLTMNKLVAAMKELLG